MCYKCNFFNMVQFYFVFFCTSFCCFLAFLAIKKAVKMFSPLQSVDLLLFSHFHRLDFHRWRAFRRCLEWCRCRWLSIF